MVSPPLVEQGPTLQPLPTTSKAMLIDPRSSVLPLSGLICRGKDDPLLRQLWILCLELN